VKKLMKNTIYYQAFAWIFLAIIFSMSNSCSEDIVPDDDPVENDSIPLVFVSGTEGYACYRTPAIVVTHEGTVLAFCGGRVNSCDDEGDIDIVLKRSTDGGKTWGPIMVLENDGANPCKIPTPVVLSSGRILLLWLWNKSIPSESDRTSREVYITYSDDDGLTWAKSRNITSQVYESNWGWYGIGPGHAIVKELEPHKGRIIVPARHNSNVAKMTSHIIYSDDEGETWHIGAIALRESTTESIAVELSNGDVMLNSRNSIKEQYARVVHISSDGGESFDRIYLDTDLPDAGACQGSLLKHSLNDSTGKYNILFSNPDHRDERVNGSLKLSMDDGENWVRKYRYSDPYPAFSGYSDITLINGDDVAVLFETGPHYIKQLRYEGIGFKIVSFNEISDPL
jgi:sialidase-1